MFCWAEAENSIKMRGGKNLPLAQSRRSRCSGSLLACFTKTGPRETWRFLKTKRYKTFLKKVQQQIQTTLVSEKRREDKKEQIPKKNEEKRSKTSLILNFSYHACSRKNGPKLKSQIMSIGEPDCVSTFWLQKCFQSLVKIDDWPHLDYIYLKGSFGAQATWARPLWPPLDSICLCVSMFDQVVIIFRGLRIW